MRITIASVGRLKAGAERDLFTRYAKRIDAAGRKTGIGPLQNIELSESSRRSAGERRKEEAEALLRKIPQGAVVIALDETGTAVGSEAFAKLVAKYRDQGAAVLVFAIGGADGHGRSIAERADCVLALGPMTLPHALARIVLAEQLYRAITILSGHPYHRS